MPDHPSESPQGLASGREIDRAALFSACLSATAGAFFLMAEKYLTGDLRWAKDNWGMWVAMFVVTWYPLVKAKVKAGEPASKNSSAPPPPTHSG